MNSSVFGSNNTICYNAAQSGGGVALDFASSAMFVNSIAWRNLPDQLSALCLASYCDVEGGFPGSGNINVDPLFVDSSKVDFRLTCGSPCVDVGTNSPGLTLPPFDQSGLDLRIIGSTIDIGADEAGTFWDFNGPAIVGGPAVNFTATATTGQNGNLSEVYVSLGDGSSTGGLSVPGAGGRSLGLDLDSIFTIWLGLPTALRQATLAGCSPGASTFAFTIPHSTPVGQRVYYAGLTWDLSASVLTSISGTRSFVTQ